MEVPDYYTGFTQVEVEQILAVQKGELKKALASYSESGTSVTKRQVAEINAIIKGCQNALRRFAPTTYGRRRRVAFSRVGGCLSR